MLSFYIAIFVQVVLESLPVSSSGHIRLLEQFLRQTYSKELMYLLHIPTLIILLIFFYKHSLLFIRQYKNNLFSFVKLLFFIGIIDAITTLFFIFFQHYNQNYFLQNERTLVIGLSITAVLLYSLRWITRKQNNDALTVHSAFIIGIAQGCALLPGISRFATVYTVCNWLKMSSARAFYMTWLIQAPLIVAAVCKTILFKNISAELTFLVQKKTLCVCILATVIAYYALAKSYEWAIHNRLWRCAYYMIIPILLALFCINYYT